MTWGTRMSLASNAALINLTLPVATALFAVIFLRRAHDRASAGSASRSPSRVCCSAPASISASLSFGGRLSLGNLLIFAATLGSAFYNSYGKKALEWHSPMQMLFWTYVAVCSMMAPIVLVEEGSVFARIPHFTLHTWIGMALLTFFHNYLSMILFLKALKKLDAIQAALSNYLITFFGVPIAAIWLGERLTARQWWAVCWYWQHAADHGLGGAAGRRGSGGGSGTRERAGRAARSGCPPAAVAGSS